LATAGALAATTSFPLAAAEPTMKIRVGQIGTKHPHAGGKISTLRKLSDVFEVVGVVEPDAQRRAQVENTAPYQGVKWLSMDELLNSPGLQAVAVESHVQGLLDAAEACIAADLHIHLDKPAGESFEHFQKIVAQAKAKKRIIQMGYMFRGNPGFRFLYQAVRNGWLGEIFEIHGVMSKAVGDSGREFLSQFPGGSMFELGCHLVDALVTVLGKPDRVTAFPRQTRDDGVVDNSLAAFEYPQATATLRSAVVEIEGQRRRQFIVCGTQGTIEIHPLETPRLRLTLDRPRGDFKKGPQEVPLPKSPGRYDEQLLHLANAIAGKEPYEYSLDHDLAVQETVLRASGVWKQ